MYGLGWILTILGWWAVATAAFYAIIVAAAVADAIAGTVSVQEILLGALGYIVVPLALGLALIRWGKRMRTRGAAPRPRAARPKRPESN